MLCEYNRSVIALTETWLSQAVDNTGLGLNDYSIYRLDRVSRGGVVLIGIRREIPSRIVNSSQNFEILSVDIRVHDQLLRVITCYLPTIQKDDYVKGFILELNNFIFISAYIILGDFNMPDIDWSCDIFQKDLFIVIVIGFS